MLSKYILTRKVLKTRAASPRGSLNSKEANFLTGQPSILLATYSQEIATEAEKGEMRMLCDEGSGPYTLDQWSVGLRIHVHIIVCS